MPIVNWASFVHGGSSGVVRRFNPRASVGGQTRQGASVTGGSMEQRGPVYPICMRCNQKHPGDCSVAPGRCYICRGEGHRWRGKPRKALPSLNPNALAPVSFNVLEHTVLPELAEEDLEWLSNKDAFPAVETCFGMLSEEPGSIPKHHSPVSVLENSTTSSTSISGNSCNGSIIMSYCSLRVPVKARSKRRHRRPREIRDQERWWSRENITRRKPAVSVAKMGRKCQHCGVEKTPQWRAGPDGPKTLCNACGVRYKSGRLVPEYRPANSPTFSSKLHSNSHRKVVEMRRQKQMMGSFVVKPMDKG